MRNDARPIGDDSSLKSGEEPHGQEVSIEREQPDGGDSVAQRRQPHVVNREEDRDGPAGPLSEANS